MKSFCDYFCLTNTKLVYPKQSVCALNNARLIMPVMFVVL